MKSEEESEAKKNVFEELHRYLEEAGYFTAGEQEKKAIWKKIAKMWNVNHGQD